MDWLARWVHNDPIKTRGIQMFLLHIEHSVANFETWKAAFDSDPVGRQRSGVHCYRVLRAVDNPNLAIIDLEFNSLNQAESLLAAMQQVWGRVGGTLIQDPQWRMAEVIETKTY